MKVIRLNEAQWESTFENHVGKGDNENFNYIVNKLIEVAKKDKVNVDWFNHASYQQALHKLVAGSNRDINKQYRENILRVLNSEGPDGVREYLSHNSDDSMPEVISDAQKPNFDKNNAAIGDYEVAYINSYNIDQRGLIVRDVLNKLTPNTNAGNIINNLYGGQSGEIDRDKVFGQMKGNIIRVEDNNGKVIKKLKLDSNEKGYSNYVLNQFIDAFKWKELYKGNTFIKLLNSNVFKKTFKNPQTPLMISRRGLKGQTIDLKYAFESLYNAYCANDLDDYANKFSSMKEDEFTDVILSVIDLSKKYDQINKDHDQLAKNINDIKDDNALNKLIANIDDKQAEKLLTGLQKRVQETNKQ